MTSLPIFCKEFFDVMDESPRHFGKKVWAVRDRIEAAFGTEDLSVDLDLYEKYVSQGKYYDFGRLYPWERCLIGLMLCTFKADGMPRWNELYCFLGRGAGKDGFITVLAHDLISPYNPSPYYDVDIFGYNEDQAKRPFLDIFDMMKNRYPGKMGKHFKWTREEIVGKKNGGVIKYHANNAKGKDGLRSGAVIFNEVHAYENNKQIDVGITGLGKKKHPRQFYFSTNGNVDEGPFDEMMKEASEVLSNPDKSDDGKLFFIFELDSKDEVDDEDLWHKANPSLIYKPELMTEIRKEYKKWKANPAALPAFMTKRMNIRQSDQKLPVATKEQIMATNKEIPYGKIKGMQCVAGIDYAQVNDWAAANLHFLLADGSRVDLNHAWVCTQSDRIRRLRCPYQEWARCGDITLVDAPTISPSLIGDWLFEMNQIYRIKTVVVDYYRYDMIKNELRNVGFADELKNIKTYRPSDIMRTSPLITKCFCEERFIWGNKPYLRWATNNTMMVKSQKSKVAESGKLDIGNYVYGKIEPETRKTDPFMALVASMTEERILSPAPDIKKSLKKIRVYAY